MQNSEKNQLIFIYHLESPNGWPRNSLANIAVNNEELKFNVRASPSGMIRTDENFNKAPRDIAKP